MTNENHWDQRLAGPKVPGMSRLQNHSSRRQALKTLSCGFGYLAFAAMAAQQSRAQAESVTPTLDPKPTHFPARAQRVIFLCMKGGPSHVDLFDHKPDLAKHAGKAVPVGDAGLKGRLLPSPHEFQQYGDSGLRMSKLWKNLSRHADDLCVINSMNTDLPNHPQAFGQMHTGSFQFVRPSMGAWTLYGLGSENQNLPGFVTLNPPADFGGARNYGSAFLPAVCQGTRIGGGQIPELYAKLLGKDEEAGPPLKNIENHSMTRTEQRRQLDLIRELNQRKLTSDRYHPEIEGAIESFELAFRMQSEVPDVLDLAAESRETHELYGIGQGRPGDRFARQCLLARRLIESGVRFVEVTAPDNWDHHRLLKDNLEKACLGTDEPIAALLTDLKQRGLLEDTLVVWSGEFGRTPYAQSGDGRDHNNKGYTSWMAGGGVRGGLHFGATDEFGYEAVEDPVHIHDWHATILHLLGLDHTRLTFDYGGRPFRLTDVYGDVVHGIIQS